MMSNTRVIPGQTEWDPEDADLVAVPLCGGIFKDESGSTETIVPWVGTDPDSNIQNYTWDQDNEKWIFPTELFDKSQPKIKGPNHPGQFRPLGFKDSCKTQELCIPYSGSKLNGLPTSKDIKANILLKNYKDACRQHMIKQGMWDFLISQPQQDQYHGNCLKIMADFLLNMLKIILSYYRKMKVGLTAMLFRI